MGSLSAGRGAPLVERDKHGVWRMPVPVPGDPYLPAHGARVLVSLDLADGATREQAQMAADEIWRTGRQGWAREKETNRPATKGIEEWTSSRNQSPWQT